MTLARPGARLVVLAPVTLLLLASLYYAIQMPRPSLMWRLASASQWHVIVLVPVAEELYFRGLLLDHLRRGLGPVCALVGVTALFALLHVSSAFLAAALLSLAACLLVLCGRSLLMAVQLHVAWNCLSCASQIEHAQTRW